MREVLHHDGGNAESVEEDMPTGPIVAGLDISELGSDVTVFFPRRGPCAMDPIHWQGANTSESAWRAKDHAVKLGVQYINYDSIGIGAGLRGAWSSPEKKLPFNPNPVNSGSTPTDNYWPDGSTSKEKFRNLRAELWWTLRARFEKAYEFKEKGVKHPLDEMISIPNNPQLIAELSLPLVEHTETGKIQLESKQRMRARGVHSPNFGDALALAFIPVVDWGTGQIVDHSQRGILAAARRAHVGNVGMGRPSMSVDGYSYNPHNIDNREEESISEQTRYMNF